MNLLSRRRQNETTDCGDCYHYSSERHHRPGRPDLLCPGPPGPLPGGAPPGQAPVPHGPGGSGQDGGGAPGGPGTGPGFSLLLHYPPHPPVGYRPAPAGGRHGGGPPGVHDRVHHERDRGPGLPHHGGHQKDGGRSLPGRVQLRQRVPAAHPAPAPSGQVLRPPRHPRRLDAGAGGQPHRV